MMASNAPIRKWLRGLPAVLTVSCVVLSGGACVGNASHRVTLKPGEGRSFALLLGDDLGVVEYVQHRIRNVCLAQARYPQNLDTIIDGPTNLLAEAVPTERTFGPTTEEEARRLGFGADLPAEPPSIVSFSRDYDRNLQRCTDMAWHRLGKDAAATYRNYLHLANALTTSYPVEFARRVPADTAATNFDCMSGLGYPPPDRAAFLVAPNPVKQYRIAFGVHEGAPSTWEPVPHPGSVQVGPPTPARRYLPTPTESALAVAWYQCGQQTRRVERFLAISRAVQRDLVARYQSELAVLNPRVKALAKTAASMARGRVF